MSQHVTQRLCAKCEVIKAAADFYTSARRSSGFEPYCKACHAEKAKRRKTKDPAAYLAKSAINAAAWRVRNPEKAREATERSANKKRAEELAKRNFNLGVCKRCGLEKPASEMSPHKQSLTGFGKFCIACVTHSREETNQRAREWRQNNHEKFRAYQNARKRTEEFKAYEKAYLQRPEVRETLRLRWQIKAAKRGGERGSVPLNRRSWIAVQKAFGGVCCYCDAPGKMTVDHIDPVNRGGSNAISNIAPSCFACNAGKRDKTIETFAPARAASIRATALKCETDHAEGSLRAEAA